MPWEFFGFFWSTGSVGAVTFFDKNDPKMQFFVDNFLDIHRNLMSILDTIGRGPRRPCDLDFFGAREVLEQ